MALHLVARPDSNGRARRCGAGSSTTRSRRSERQLAASSGDRPQRDLGEPGGRPLPHDLHPRELDKVKDGAGAQLDAVIRYFKNLFTQAPALFFFLTDKDYFDLVSKRIAEGRAERSYAVEHTFFTHRIFVTRPSFAECLDYFRQVFEEPTDKQAVENVLEVSDARSRSSRDMTGLEQFLRCQLFACNNHLFGSRRDGRSYGRPGSAFRHAHGGSSRHDGHRLSTERDGHSRRHVERRRQVDRYAVRLDRHVLAHLDGDRDLGSHRCVRAILYHDRIAGVER